MRCTARRMKRPADVSVAVGMNRTLPAPLYARFKSEFAPHPEPPRRIIHNYRYFLKPGKATTGPPLGQDLTHLGIKPMDFVKAFNDRTKPIFRDDIEIIVRMQVYEDKSFQYRIDGPPAAWYILRAVRKKRRETDRNTWSCFISLEMLYEIAKQKMWEWGNPEYPPIEIRVRSLVGQARQMGICVLGVDAPSSPVHGMTEAEYEKKCAEYQKTQWGQWLEVENNQLLEAPLYYRAHLPDISKLTPKEVEEGLRDPRLYDALWKVSHPTHRYNRDLPNQESALRFLRHRAWSKGATIDEMRSLYENKDLPTTYLEKLRGQKTTDVPTTHWSV